MAHLVNASGNGNQATYVIQVYSAFSPPHLTPLLVRLSESATVRDAIHASLSKLLTQDPTTILPSDIVDEYTMRCAGGEGQPMYQSISFEPTQILREATGLEFPFMVYLGYNAGGSRVNTKDTTQTMTSNGSEMGNGVLGGASGKHIPLSAIEKAALEAHRREIEARREENVKQIERRRFEQQMKAFHHAESYELQRKEEAAKRAELALKAEQERILRNEEAALTQARDAESRRAQLEAVKKGNERVVEQMRKEMQNAIQGDAKRREELAEALEIRRKEQAHAAAMAQESKRLMAEANRHQRTEEDFSRLLDDLHSSIENDVCKNEEHVSADRSRRQLFQRADADSHAIAIIEQQRNFSKQSLRHGRITRDELDQQRMEVLLAQKAAAEKAEEERSNTVLMEWRDKQDVNREHLTSQIEASMLQERLGTGATENERQSQYGGGGVPVYPASYNSNYLGDVSGIRPL